MNPRRVAVVGVIVGVVGVVAAAGMGVAYVAKGNGTGGSKATSEGFFVEPTGSVGPDAFTPSVVVTGSTTCDKAKFVKELQARPDALREWARVLGITQEQVPAYVMALQPTTLQSDTKVTNHGLHNGQAYARQSLLKSGTAVLVDPAFPATGPPPSVPEVTPTSTPTTTGVPTTPGATTAVPHTPTPVTRCKCGNPLLPPYSFTPPATTAPTTSTSTTSTSVPTTITRPSTPTRPSGTTPSSSTTSPPSSTEPSSTSASSLPGSTG